MKLEEIEQILNHYHAAKEIYKLHLEDKLHMCITLALQSGRGFQTQADIIDKIIAKGEELQQELKTLEE